MNPKKTTWIILIIPAVVLSQFLIFTQWEAAKFGTLLNILLLVIAIPAIGNLQFQKRAKKETIQLLSGMSNSGSQKTPENEFQHLPAVVQKWIQTSGSSAVPEIKMVYLKQQGKMRTKPNGRWMHFSAEQYFNIEDPGFIWTTKVNAVPLLYLDGRDLLKNGEGHMLIKFLSLFPVVNEGGNEQINTGSMLRFLGEICWFPSAAKNDYLQWKSTGENSARANFIWKGKKVSGEFHFNDSGELVFFEAMRYRSSKNLKKDLWRIDVLENAEVNGVKIPTRCEVTWKLPEGDFSWLRLEITALVYNPPLPC